MRDFNPIPAVLRAGQCTVGRLISNAAGAHADSIALSFKETALSYSDLDRRTNQIANFLLNLGVKQQDRLAILASNDLDYLQIIIAAAKIGAIAACQNWRLGIRELQHCVTLVTPKIIFYTEDTKTSLNGIDICDAKSIAFGQELADLIGSQPDHYPDIDVETEDGLVIIYTSGTTGLPKGAVISHRAMIARGLILQADLVLPKQDHFMAWPPLFHMIATDQSLGMLMRGSRVHIVNGYDVDEMSRLIETFPMGLLPLVPGMVGAFVSELQKRGVSPQKMNYVGAMADLVPRAEIELATAFFKAPYFNTFGATETGIGPASGGAGAIQPGKVPERIPKVQNSTYDVLLVDADDNEVPIGTPGEVSITGPALFSGYWNNDEANENDFRGGRFHMGDVLKRDEQGRYEYVDRVKYMIKSGGENIYPAEIETVICQDEKIETAVVVKKQDDKWGEVPIAFIVARDETVTEDSIKSNCLENLSRYKHPKDYYFIQDADLPRSTTGKIQRHILEQKIPT